MALTTLDLGIYNESSYAGLSTVFAVVLCVCVCVYVCVCMYVCCVAVRMC